MTGLVPKTLAYAAKAYGKNPKKLGEVVLAICGQTGLKLDEGQQVVVAICRGELEDRAEVRARAAAKKREWRAKTGRA